ncbi:ATP-binding protein [Phytohabitans flavus]|uniref:histidine kinase n=1 Tax=Phytohabitans flavus TaxID=1076124 RepID=A0A6F8XSS2_9ACTN|nr:hybrid sensor histidine kinase/response regulator [Phytohabitans flavus]BCB76798.1 hybrid sensor histidine kinase/response regulator [Phytohabitans flavus]
MRRTDEAPTGTGDDLGLGSAESRSAALPAGLTALVVDDDPDFAGLLRRLLEGQGIEVHVAESVADAEALSAAYIFDIALIDYRLGPADQPARTGLHVATAVRRTSPNALVIVLTGYSDRVVAREAIRVRVDDVISKAGLTVTEFTRTLAESLERKRQRDTQLGPAYLESVVNQSLANVAHELRSPLVSIMRQTEALISGALGSLSGDQHTGAASISDEARRGLNLINAHLDLNRIEHRITRLEPAEHDVAAILADEVESYTARAAAKGVSINRSTPSVPTVARVDLPKLRSALNPIMDNALKYCRERGRIDVAVRVQDEHVVIEVHDDGPGMRADDVDRVLRPDTWGGTAPSPRARGTGLGLTIARRFSELHGGHLEIGSPRDGGTTVRLWLRQYPPTEGTDDVG